MRDFIPRGYQSIALDFFAQHDRCALWAGCGMGKTVTTLTHLHHLHNVWGEDRPTLVLAPLRVARDVWTTEAGKWRHLAGLDIAPITGTLKEREAALRRDVPIFTMNYDNLVWLRDWFQNHRKAWPFATVVADEATRLKGFRVQQGGARAQALGQFAHKSVRRFIELTGTPSPNGLRDLWGQLYFVDAGRRLGTSFTAFEDRWFKSVRKGNSEFMDKVPVDGAQDEIMARLADVCLSIDARDWFDLYAPVVNTVYVDLPASGRRHYREMERELFTTLTSGEEIEAFNAAAKSMKCLQAANGAMYLDPDRYGPGKWVEIHEAKLDALESIVEESSGLPVLVAIQFKSDRERILRAFPKWAVDLADDEGMVAFRKGNKRIGIAHPASLGHGIDGLQDVTNVAAVFGHWWNLEEYQQFVERIGPTRQAQSDHDRPVFIHHIVARDTLDEVVIARREGKRSVQDILLDYMKGKKV